MKPYQIIAHLIKLGAKLKTVKGQLNISASQKIMTNELQQQIKEHKKEIIEILESLYKKTKIEKAVLKEHYTLSSAQRRMHFLYSLDKDALAYNMPQVIKIDGELNYNKLELVFKKLIKRHESLRTSFHTLQGEIVQKIAEDVPFKIECFECNEAESYEVIDNFIKPFDLKKAPLIRVALINIGKNSNVLVVDTHHIILDGVSQGILMNDFLTFYSGGDLEGLKLQYKDYAEWQQDEQNKGVSYQKEFWLNEFTEEINALELPFDFPRPKERSYSGGVVEFSINKLDVDVLRKVGEEQGATLFMTMLSIFNVFLSRLSNQEDIVVGTPVAGRQDASLEGVMGMFVNTLPLRNFPEATLSFLEFLEIVRDKTLQCIEYQSYQYEDLVEALQIPRNMSRNPLFDVMFGYENFYESKFEIPGLKLEAFGEEQKTSKFDLTLSITELPNEMICSFNYATSLFKEETIYRFITYFKKIISEVCKKPSVRLKNIDILSEEEEYQLLNEFNKEKVVYPEVTILDVLEKQVSQNPNNIALKYNEERLTYKEFNDLVNKVAITLSDKGIGDGNLVGVMMERSFDIVVTIFGILKSGAAYIPISPSYPKERVSYILDDSNASLIIIDNDVYIEKYSLKIDTGLYRNIINTSVARMFNDEVSSSSLAYIIYTSGSTGKPKGVKVTHKSITNLVYWLQERYPLNEPDSFLLKTNYVFDVSVSEFFGWLIGGGSLTIAPKNIESDAKGLINIIKNNKITHINFVPSMFTVFTETIKSIGADAIESLKYIFLAGEVFPISLYKNFLSIGTSIKLENLYGPTEATVFSTAFSTENFIHNTSIPIGKAINNAQLYVLDTHNRLLPVGVAGELCIAGEGLAVGYQNRQELTDEKFINHPFKENEKLYKTGDLVRWLKDGNIEFLGRIDNQVKIRGYRIELGEIENQLLSHIDIQDTVVLVKEKAGDKHIVAYYTAQESKQTKDLKTYLLSRLPAYMLPTFYVFVKEFPLTPSGKVNKRLLPNPEVINEGIYIAPSTKTERILVEIWADVLELDKKSISVNKSFMDLGGHSLKATVMVNRILKDLQVEVPLREVFKYETIKDLALFILKQEKNTYVEIKQSENKGYYPLSSVQKRLYFIYGFDNFSLVYNMPQIMKIEGEVDQVHLENVFQKLINRHESFRTTFEMIDYKVVQVISDEVVFSLEYFENEEGGVDKAIEKFVRPFDLSEGPLLRAGIVKMNEKQFVLMVDMHHIIVDGLSMEVIKRNFKDLYAGKELPKSKLQYKDYIEWQQTPEYLKKIQKQKEFWLKEFEVLPKTLELPVDRKHSDIRDYNGNSIVFSLDKSQTSKLRSLADNIGATMYVPTITIFNILLSKIGNQEDVVIGSIVSGREHADLQDIVGMFVNTLPLRNYPKGELTFKQFMEEVKDRTFSCLENQSYPYESLLEEIELPRNTKHNPLFDVTFAFQNYMDNKDLEAKGLSFESFREDTLTAKFDLTLTASDTMELLYLTFTYATALFNKETINRFIEYVNNIVNQVCNNPEIKLADIDILSAKEKEDLKDFNLTKRLYPLNKTVIDLFDEQVIKTPKGTAIVFENRNITYAELNNKANILAQLLVNKKVRKEVVVGVLLRPSVEVIISVLGVLKAGAAFTMIDTELPTERIQYILKDSNAKILISEESIIEEIAFENTFLDLKSTDFNTTTKFTFNTQYNSNDLAYVVYTSGSSGLPKGVMIEHHSLTNLCCWHNEEFEVTSYDNSTKYAGLSFDASIWEIFPYLIQGATLHILSDNLKYNVQAINTYFEENKISIAFLPTQLCEQFLLLENNSLRYLLTGGDTLKQVNKNQYTLVNNYGPTENTVVTTSYKVKLNHNNVSIPIGKPIANTSIFIVDSSNNLVPIGVVGELCIGGEGIARGYVNKEELNKEKFIETSFFNEGKVYKTGDLARWLPDGNLEFLGRNDNQVNIRGFRIELGEIEVQLNNYPNILDVIVNIVEKDRETYIVAYYVASSTTTVNELRSFLTHKLPEYMLPSYYVPLKEMPLTVNGKIDKRGLPLPKFKLEEDYVGSSNDTEKILVNIWSEILNLSEETISTNRSFFELGGHSLKAVVMVNKIYEELEVIVTLKSIFEKLTIKEISNYIITLRQVDEVMEEDEDVIKITI